MALVAICTVLVAELVAFFRNDDDLVYRREIAFTTSGLDAWAERPNHELSFMFDGGSNGKHELWLTCEQGFIPGDTTIPVSKNLNTVNTRV